MTARLAKGRHRAGAEAVRRHRGYAALWRGRRRERRGRALRRRLARRVCGEPFARATAEFEIRLQDGAQPASVEAQTLHDDDLFAANTLYDQNRVTPHANGSAMYDAESGVVRVSLPPVSWTALHIK